MLVKMRLLPQSGRPLEGPSKGSENNAIVKITNLYQGRYCKNEKTRNVELARGLSALGGRASTCQPPADPTSNHAKA